MRLSLLSLGVLVSVLGCSSSAQLSSASGGAAGKSGSGGAAGSAGSPASGGAGGAAAAGGAGGAAAAGGAGGVATGGAAGQGGGQGVDAGMGCQWGHNNPCPSGYFCNATGCGAGTCIPKLTKTGNQYNPVCGCDGVTYWNPSVAGYFGMAVNTTGACIATAVKCSKASPCAAGLHCNNRRDQALCAVPSTLGVCWGLPEQCPADPKGQPCVAPTTQCTSKCDLIQTETPWYVGSCG